MYFYPTIYLLPLLLVAIFSGGLALYAIFYRTESRSQRFGLLTFTVAAWSLGYALEIAGANLATKVLFAQIEYIGIVILPVIWLAFALNFVQSEDWLSRRRLLGLLCVPLITIILAFTNDAHHLLWSATYLDESGPFLALGIDHGPWFWVHFVYSYLLLLIGTILFIGAAVRMPSVYRQQAVTVLIAALVPWVGNVLYITDTLPVPHLDLTPFAFSLTSALFAWSIFGFQMLDLVPVARASILEGMRDGVMMLDMQSRVVDMNYAASKMIDLTKAQAIGRRPEDVFGEQFHLLQPDPSGSESKAEIRLGTGAQCRDIELRMSVVQDQHLRVLGRLLMLRDITQQKRDAERLQLQAYRIELLNELTHAAIEQGDVRDMLRVQARCLGLLLDADACYIDLWDAQRAQMLPMAAAGMLQGVYAELQLPEPQPVWSEVVLQTEQTLAVEDLHQHAEIRSAMPSQLEATSVLGLPLIHANSHLGAAVVTFTKSQHFSDEVIALGEQAARQIALAVANIQLYQAMRDQHSRLQAMISTNRDGVILVGVDQHILVVNQSALQLLQLPGQADAWINRPFRAALEILRGAAPEVVSTSETELLRVGAGDERPGEGEFAVFSRVIHWFNLPVREGSIALGRLLVLHDVTERHLIDRMREDLTHTMVHDLRNPLTAILGSLKILQKIPFPDEDTRELLQIAFHSTNSMLNLVKAILDVSRLESGQMALNLAWCSLQQLVNETFDLQAPLVAEKGLQLINYLPPQLPSVWVDADLLRRVLQNLVGNAIKFTARGGRITVSASPSLVDATELIVSVSDTGVGIPADLRERLFEKFVTGTVAGSGSGLGLAFCRQAIEAHGGKIWIEDSLVPGAQFNFTLPIGQSTYIHSAALRDPVAQI